MAASVKAEPKDLTKEGDENKPGGSSDKSKSTSDRVGNISGVLLGYLLQYFVKKCC
jgi:F0F1-type ATP synthase assembly protein I